MAECCRACPDDANGGRVQVTGLSDWSRRAEIEKVADVAPLSLLLHTGPAHPEALPISSRTPSPVSRLVSLL